MKITGITVQQQRHIFVWVVVGIAGYVGWRWHVQHTKPLERRNASVSGKDFKATGASPFTKLHI